MRLIFAQIEAFEEPAKFLQTAGVGAVVGAGVGEWVCVCWPDKFVAFQALLPQAKSVAVPVQRFDFVAMAVGEDVQRAGKGVQAQFLFDEHAQAVYGFSEVDGYGVQVDLLNGAARVHQCAPWAQRAKATSHWGSGGAVISRRTPAPRTSVQLAAAGCTG